MASIRNSIQTNRRLLIFVTGLLVVIILFLGKFYLNQRQENRALRIKILSMGENKRTPKPWSQMVTKTQPKAATSTAATVTPAATSQPAANDNANTSLSEQDTQDLVIKLQSQMRRVKNVEAEILDNNIAIANELISREPDSYGAYKAKLISMLVKEGKFSQALDESEVENTLENMAQFNLSSDKLARREASLIATTNQGIQDYEDQLDELARERETTEELLTSLGSDLPENEDLRMDIQQIEARKAEVVANITTLENNLNNNTNQLVNEDIVEIPFMRMLAQNDYQSVIDNAQSFIEQFPASPNGYYYLVRSLELQGQKDQALSVIQNSQLPPESRQELIKRLEADSTQDPKNYWQKLNF